MSQELLDRLFVLLQWLLPERLLGRMVYRLARLRTPWIRTLFIRLYTRVFAVDLSEAEQSEPEAYEHLNAFFTRSLRPGARPIAGGADAVVSPADGTVEELAYASGDALIQAKRFRYRLVDLLATDDATAAAFNDGAVLTVYLAPHDYHRVHMPIAGRVREMVHVPGRRWAVNRRTARTVPGLFTTNERVICWCEGAAGRFIVVLVGAMNVASISVAWAGEIPPARDLAVRRWSYPDDDPRMAIPAGGLLGQFNLGSTVIFVAERGTVRWDGGPGPGATVRMGQRLGHRVPDQGQPP